MKEYFDYIRNRGNWFDPVTPVAALKAYNEGFVPFSSFIYKASSTRPLDEQPYDLEAIERLLSRENLGLQTSMILMGIFEKLVMDKDQERALFAAESINTIENRYNKKIQKHKEEESWGNLGILYYELATLNSKRPNLKSFYLGEAREAFLKVEGDWTHHMINSSVRTLIEMKELESALSLVRGLFGESTVHSLLLEGEIAFASFHMVRVLNICNELIGRIEELNEKDFVTVSYWLGG